MFRNQFFALAKIVGGMAIGYLLWHPFLQLPAEASMRLLLPVLTTIDDFTSSYGAWYVAPAVFAFFTSLPNTLLVSLAAAFMLRDMAYRRLVFYSAFAVPALFYPYFWYKVWRLKLGAQQLGLPADMEHLPIDPNEGGNALLILMTYTLFTLIVLVVQSRSKNSRGIEHA